MSGRTGQNLLRNLGIYLSSREHFYFNVFYILQKHGDIRGLITNIYKWRNNLSTTRYRTCEDSAPIVS